MRNMRLIYVAGKYSGKDFYEIDRHILTAKLASVQLLKRGWAVITPHLNTCHFELFEKEIGYTHEDWLKMDFVMLERCDAIFMLENWQQSKGATMELEFAKEKGLKIYFEKDGYPDERNENK
jgi:hypothetical protein